MPGDRDVSGHIDHLIPTLEIFGNAAAGLSSKVWAVISTSSAACILGVSTHSTGQKSNHIGLLYIRYIKSQLCY